MSWAIISLDTEEAVLETWDSNVVEKLNTEKYKAIPILLYLQNLKREIKAKTLTLPD